MKQLIATLFLFIFTTDSNYVFSQHTQELELSLISEIPKEFDGCIGSYAFSNEEVENGQIILFDGWDGMGSEVSNYFSFIKVNDKLERLQLIERTREEYDPRNETSKYGNESYTATLHVNYLKPSGYDSYYNEVKLELKSKNNEEKSLTLKLIGLVGC